MTSALTHFRRQVSTLMRYHARGRYCNAICRISSGLLSVAVGVRAGERNVDSCPRHTVVPFTETMDDCLTVPLLS